MGNRFAISTNNGIDSPILWVGWYTTVFGYRVLLSLTERVGPVPILGGGLGP